MLHWHKEKPSYARAIDRFKTHMVSNQGTNVPNMPPVQHTGLTGISMPNLYNWGKTEFERTCTKWLLSAQRPKGAKYFANSEVSWGEKCFFDAWRMELQGEGKHA